MEALIAIDEASIRVYEETGVIIDSIFSVELLLTLFHPKAALHDGGVIVRNGRIAAATASSRSASGKRSTEPGSGIAPAGNHRGIRCDRSGYFGRDGGISICHRRRIERNFTRTFQKRIGEILLQHL